MLVYAILQKVIYPYKSSYAIKLAHVTFSYSISFDNIISHFFVFGHFTLSSVGNYRRRFQLLFLFSIITICLSIMVL